MKARYLVLIERELGDQDGRQYHDGTGKGAVAQLAKELQAGFDEGSLDGRFRIADRVIEADDNDLEAAVMDLTMFMDDDPAEETPIQKEVARYGLFMNERITQFFMSELRNEAHGGVAPATLKSALDSVRQAPGDVLEEWFGEEVEENLVMLLGMALEFDGDTELHEIMVNFIDPEEKPTAWGVMVELARPGDFYIIGPFATSTEAADYRNKRYMRHGTVLELRQP